MSNSQVTKQIQGVWLAEKPEKVQANYNCSNILECYKTNKKAFYFAKKAAFIGSHKNKFHEPNPNNSYYFFILRELEEMLLDLAFMYSNPFLFEFEKIEFENKIQKTNGFIAFHKIPFQI